EMAAAEDLTDMRGLRRELVPSRHNADGTTPIRQFGVPPAALFAAVSVFAGRRGGQPEFRRAVASPFMVSRIPRLTSSESSPPRNRRSSSTCIWFNGSRYGNRLWMDSDS